MPPVHIGGWYLEIPSSNTQIVCPQVFNVGLCHVRTFLTWICATGTFYVIRGIPTHELHHLKGSYSPVFFVDREI